MFHSLFKLYKKKYKSSVVSKQHNKGLVSLQDNGQEESKTSLLFLYYFLLVQKQNFHHCLFISFSILQVFLSQFHYDLRYIHWNLKFVRNAT